MMLRCGLALALLGCESTTFVDCPTFEQTSCLDTEECRYSLYGDGSGECRTRCDPFLEEEPCPDGYHCDLVEYWEPTQDELAGPLDDLCVEN